MRGRLSFHVATCCNETPVTQLHDCSSLIGSAKVVTYHNHIAGLACARVIQLTAYPVLSQVYIVTIMIALSPLPVTSSS